MKMKPSQSFLAVTIQRAGVRKASRVGSFVLAWTTVHADLGHRPSVEEYAEWWKVSPATAYREQAEFREVWPEFLTPSDVALALGVDPANSEMPNPFAMPNPLAVE